MVLVFNASRSEAQFQSSSLKISRQFLQDCPLPDTPFVGHRGVLTFELAAIHNHHEHRLLNLDLSDLQKESFGFQMQQPEGGLYPGNEGGPARAHLTCFY